MTNQSETLAIDHGFDADDHGFVPDTPVQEDQTIDAQEQPNLDIDRQEDAAA